MILWIFIMLSNSTEFSVWGGFWYNILHTFPVVSCFIYGTFLHLICFHRMPASHYRTCTEVYKYTWIHTLLLTAGQPPLKTVSSTFQVGSRYCLHLLLSDLHQNFNVWGWVVYSRVHGTWRLKHLHLGWGCNVSFIIFTHDFQFCYSKWYLSSVGFCANIVNTSTRNPGYDRSLGDETM